MENVTMEDVIRSLGSMSVMQLVSLTKELEEKWGVKATPPVQTFVPPPDTTKNNTQTEFTVVLASVPTDKKMAVIKLVREITLLGLKESKDLVESAPKTIRELVSAAEAEDIKYRLTEAGGVVEIK